MSIYRTLSTVACAGLLALALAACEQEGPMERAGENIDKAVEESMHTGHSAMENAGEKMDQAAKKAGEAMEEAGEAMQ